VAGSEDNDLEVLVGLLQALHHIWPDIDPCVDSFFVRKVYLQDHIRVFSFDVVHAMDQRFIHVKDQHLRQFWPFWVWEVDDLVLDVLVGDHGEVVVDELEGLEGLEEVDLVEVLAPFLILILLSLIPIFHLILGAYVLVHDGLHLLGLVLGDVGGGLVEFEGRLALLLLQVRLVAGRVRHLRHERIQLLLVVLVLVRLLHLFLLHFLLQFLGVPSPDVAVEGVLAGGHEVGLALAVLLELLGEAGVHDLRLVALPSHLHDGLIVQLVLIDRLAHIQ